MSETEHQGSGFDVRSVSRRIVMMSDNFGQREAVTKKQAFVIARRHNIAATKQNANALTTL
jgi:hypothetical protein